MQNDLNLSQLIYQKKLVDSIPSYGLISTFSSEVKIPITEESS